MIKFNPSRILHGSPMHALFKEAGIDTRLGGHALLVTDTGLERDGVISTVRSDLARSGIESILFDAAGENAMSDVVKNAASLASGGRAGFVIGLGSPITLDIAKIISLISGAGQDVHHFIDTDESGPVSGGLPFLAIPTRCWNPLLFSDLAVIVDARDGAAMPINTGVRPDSVFFSTEPLGKLTDKQIVYDLLCILASTIEAIHSAAGGVGYPLVTDASESAISILGAIPTTDTPPDREAAQIAGIHSAWFSSLPGAGNALGRAAHAQAGIAPEWITAALLPGVTDYLMKQDADRISPLLPVLGLESTGNLEDDAQGIEREIRSLAGLADVPLRLRDLGLESRHFSDIAKSASRICGIGEETLHNLLNASL
jgi:alcohol dehydrogenase class IV